MRRQKRGTISRHRTSVQDESRDAYAKGAGGSIGRYGEWIPARVSILSPQWMRLCSPEPHIIPSVRAHKLSSLKNFSGVAQLESSIIPIMEFPSIPREVECQNYHETAESASIPSLRHHRPHEEDTVNSTHSATLSSSPKQNLETAHPHPFLSATGTAISSIDTLSSHGDGDHAPFHPSQNRHHYCRQSFSKDPVSFEAGRIVRSTAFNAVSREFLYHSINEPQYVNHRRRSGSRERRRGVMETIMEEEEVPQEVQEDIDQDKLDSECPGDDSWSVRHHYRRRFQSKSPLPFRGGRQAGVEVLERIDEEMCGSERTLEEG
ncbi:hypothetical protein BU23DRAFT_16602 [Bimuria novae-zelandiae CBS 107.79]|uniref:Uncharacterized protein n=1 Tax=Bimuria novae-zelandiae CBS 107.79 TaxID=1447943 RepID=A0A6A5UMC7_9PLEO|nr:hypothetical protein BU23DRAFT_16602 [Bimuria novae-zelandiae CBS 107.79]